MTTTLNPSPSGLTLITAERQRQVDVKGWTPEHDDEHEDAALAWAAACLAAPEKVYRVDIYRDSIGWREPWPSYWKQMHEPQDRVRELVKAGALIAAEIDRLLRLQAGVDETV